MLRLVWRGVRFARGRAVALAAGMLVAAAAFSLLTASVEANAADVTGVVGANWRGEYDLLVLPHGSVQTLPGQHVVQVNYLSTATSGITMSQYATVQRMPGVQVAAPLEIVGYVLETAYIPVVLSPAAAGRSGSRVLLITSRYTADQGLSVYPPHDDGYVYITPDRVTPLFPSPKSVIHVGAVSGPIEHLPDGKNVIICPSTIPPPPGQPSPFLRTIGLLNGSCFSRTGGTPGPVEGYVPWSFPVLMAGIDPRAEEQLTGLRQAVTSGRYLAEGEGAAPVKDNLNLPTVPVIGSTTSFDGDTDHVTVSLLPPAAATVARSGASQSAIMRALGSEPESPVMHDTVTGTAAWRDLLAQLANASGSGSHSAQGLGQYWLAGPVTYRPGPDGRLDPVPVSNPVSVWTAGVNTRGTYYVQAPPAAADTGFRRFTELKETAGGGMVNQNVLRLVGEFDPEKLPGFSGSGPGSPLASYRTPLLTGADAASRAALGDQPLEPDGNMAGYAQQPPLLYTTLAGAAAIEKTAALSLSYLGQGDKQTAAPIGSIRVRVSGLRGTAREKLDKIGAIGEEIARATGLQVIVTAGSSPYPVTIGLPGGKFGRPPLRLTEDWTQTGVALLVLRQADRESLALLVLILVVCALFLSSAALAGVRGRRTEIGALRAVGWGRLQVFTVMLGEVVTLGVAAGLAGTGVSAALIAGLGLRVPLWRATLVLPVAAVLAAVSGLVPSLAAARVPPSEALRPAARAPRRQGRRVRTVTGLAFTGIARVPGRSALAATGLAVGVAGLTVLLAAHVSFATSIGDSELAGLVNGSTRGTDLVSVLLTITLSAAGLADVTYLNLRERAGELAALAASGWGRGQLGRLLATEAVVTAGAGSIAGAAAGLVLAGVAFGLSVPVAAAAARPPRPAAPRSRSRSRSRCCSAHPTGRWRRSWPPTNNHRRLVVAGAEVSFSSVSKTYRTGAGLPVQALAEVTLDIPAGQAVAVTGRSGSGKSTLLHLAGAMDTPDSGTLTVNGSTLGTMSDKQRTRYRREVGFVFQRFHLLPALTACDNVAAPVLPFRTGYDKRAKAAALLAAVGLAGREHDLPAKLSGGQQQRVAIARALIGGPRLLLADEPTGNLDSATGTEVLDLLFTLHRDRGLTLILATHDPAVAARCDRVIELRDGQITADAWPRGA